jgi:aspartate racemase
LYSVDFHPIEQLQSADRWDDAGALLADAAAALERAGADVLLLCTNTMHRVAPHIEARVAIPLLHIAGASARAAIARGLHRVGLLGTRFTMEQPFYRERLQREGLAVRVPGAAERERVHRVIYDELCLGRVEESSRQALRDIAAGLVRDGAEAIILGCTELMMLLSQSDFAVPVFDTTALHAISAVDFAVNPI